MLTRQTTIALVFGFLILCPSLAANSKASSLRDFPLEEQNGNIFMAMTGSLNNEGLNQDTNNDSEGAVMDSEGKVQTTDEDANPLAEVEEETENQPVEVVGDESAQEERLVQEAEKGGNENGENTTTNQEEGETTGQEEGQAQTTEEEGGETEGGEEGGEEELGEAETDGSQTSIDANRNNREDVDTSNQNSTEDQVHNLMFGNMSSTENSGNETTVDFEKSDDIDYLTIAGGLVVGFILMIIISVRDVFQKYFNKLLLDRINDVARDVIVLVFIITLTLAVHFFFVDSIDLNINSICLTLSVFALVWIVLSIIFVIAAQSFSVGWEEKEVRNHYRDFILSEYTRINGKIRNRESLSSKESKDYPNLKNQLEYILMRQNFIYPSYLPCITESFLRDDFNFAYYLTLGLNKVIHSLFKISFATVFTAGLIIAYYFIISQIESAKGETLVFIILLPFFTIVMIQMKSKFIDIKNLLTTNFENPHEIQLLKAESVKDPWNNLTNPIPPYLSAAAEVDLKKKYLMKQKTANIHERLFWYFSPNYSLSLLHCMVVAHIVWGITFFYIYSGIGNDEVWRDVVTWILTALLFFNMFYYVPSIIYHYTLITNIEMRKDKKNIYKTIEYQRKVARYSFIRFYRLIKSAKKDNNFDERNGKNVKKFVTEIIKEAFRRINPQAGSEWDINIHSLPTLIHLCGSKLSKDELVYLARDCSTEDETIHFESFQRAVMKLTQDVKLEPFETSQEFFKAFISKSDDYITIKQLGQLLDSYKILPKDVIEDILHQAKYLSNNNNTIHTSALASFIRNTIEEHPR